MTCKTEDNLEMYYELQGNLQSESTLVFLNGLTQSTLAWGFMTPSFKQNHKIVLCDLIFQGQSDKKGEWRDFDKHARDVMKILEKENLRKVTVIGISYGSLVAQHFAVLFPERLNRLILISTFAHKTPYYEAIELGWWRALEKGGYNLMLDIMLPSVLSEGYFAKPLIPINLMKEARKDLNQSSESIFNLMKATQQRKDFRPELQKIKTPTLIIQGDRDLLLPLHLAEEVHKNIAGSKIVVIHNAGHTLNLEHVSEVSNAIVSFLEEVK